MAFILLVFAVAALSACGETEQHVTVHHEAREPKCTRDGNIEYWSCSHCDKLFSDANATAEITDVEIPASHVLVTNKAKAASCTEDGNIEYWHCENCDKLFSDVNGENKVTDVTIPAAHKLEHHAEITPTCTSDGTIEYWDCNVCGLKFSDEGAVKAVNNIHFEGGHKFSGGTCTVCVAKGTPELTYSLEGISYTVTGVTDKTLSSIVIPALHNNIPVTAIADGAFIECTALLSLEIGENIESLGASILSNGYFLPEIINRTESELGDEFLKMGVTFGVEHSYDSIIKNVGGYAFLVIDPAAMLVGYTGNDKDLCFPEEFVWGEDERILLPRTLLASDFENSILIPLINKFEALLENHLSETYPDQNFSFFENGDYEPYDLGCINEAKRNKGVQLYIEDMYNIIRTVQRSDPEAYEELMSIYNALNKIRRSYTCKNPLKYIDNPRYEKDLQQMYAEYPITKEGKAVYVYTNYVLYDTKIEIASYIKDNLPEYTLSLMCEQEAACGLEPYGKSYSVISLVCGGEVNSINMGEAVTQIYENAFARVTGLKTVNIEGEELLIASGAFGNCDYLETVSISSKTLAIQGYAFISCSKLESVYINTETAAIGAYAFRDCTALASVTFANTEGWNFDVTDPEQNAVWLKDTYCSEVWTNVQ